MLYMTGKEKHVEFLLNQALPNPLGPGHEWTHPHALVSLWAPAHSGKLLFPVFYLWPPTPKQPPRPAPGALAVPRLPQLLGLTWAPPRAAVGFGGSSRHYVTCFGTNFPSEHHKLKESSCHRRETTIGSPPGFRPNSKPTTLPGRPAFQGWWPFTGNLCLQEAPPAGWLSHLNLGDNWKGAPRGLKAASCRNLINVCFLPERALACKRSSFLKTLFANII